MILQHCTYQITPYNFQEIWVLFLQKRWINRCNLHCNQAISGVCPCTCSSQITFVQWSMLKKCIVFIQIKKGYAQLLRSCVIRMVTGKSFSEALILASTNPQYDNRLLIELRVQYMKITSSKHGKNMLCTQIVFCFDIHVIQWTIFCHFVGYLMQE